MTLGRYWHGADDDTLRAVVEAVKLMPGSDSTCGKREIVMLHVVWLVMMIAVGTNVPRQVAIERSIESCMEFITHRASVATGNHRDLWYCQGAVTSMTVGP